MWILYDGKWLFGWKLKVLIYRENSSLSQLSATLIYLHYPGGSHIFHNGFLSPNSPHTHTYNLCTSMYFSGFFWNIPDPSIWVLMSPLVLLWKPALSPVVLQCEWVFWSVLLSRLWAPRGQECCLRGLHRIPMQWPTQVVDEAALSLGDWRQ